MISAMQVLFITTGVVSFLVAILIYLVFQKESDTSSRLWATGSILMAVGMTFLAFRAHMPAWIAYGVTNYIMLQAIVLYGYSVITLYMPHKIPNKTSFSLCLLYGITQWTLNATGLREELALVASIAWTSAYGWIWIQMRQILNLRKDAPIGLFTFISLLGCCTWGLRIYLVSIFDISLSTDIQQINLISLVAAHIILISQQISYVTTRLTDEKGKKDEIIRLNASVESLWNERQALILEKEKARNELLQDVHDGFGSKLIAAQLLAEQGNLNIEDFNGYLKELINDLHLLVDTLNRDNQRFEDAIADFRYRVQRRYANGLPKIEWRIELEGIPTIDQRVTLHLLRVVQEALANALKHSNATEIKIISMFDPEAYDLTVIVSDDGVGLKDTGKIGNGLMNMEQRARQVGATFSITGTDNGTQISLKLPLAILSTQHTLSNSNIHQTLSACDGQENNASKGRSRQRTPKHDLNTDCK